MALPSGLLLPARLALRGLPVHGLLVALVVVRRGPAPRHPAGLARRYRCALLSGPPSILHILVHVLHAGLLRLQLLAQPLRELPRQARDAPPAEAPLPAAAAVVLRHPHVAHVPDEPEGQAGEEHQRAGVDQEVPVEAAARAHVAEDADEEERGAERVEQQGAEERGQAAADALHRARGAAAGDRDRDRRSGARTRLECFSNADAYFMLVLDGGGHEGLVEFNI
ncbi:hypothetical protein EYF80_046296 [Liparis tanakae]|uniref:Uncharacterized protein n=1 Tax=Liparis tanakae TaxID=230148 RepID=A0A4Z2FQT9_9TELE|nr:hypothetical protein EYF80_046296 [Liparis tanakae]